MCGKTWLRKQITKPVVGRFGAIVGTVYYAVALLENSVEAEAPAGFLFGSNNVYLV